MLLLIFIPPRLLELPSSSPRVSSASGDPRRLPPNRLASPPDLRPATRRPQSGVIRLELPRSGPSRSAVMRRGAALLLLLAFSAAAVAAAAEDSTTGVLPAGKNNGSDIADSGVGRTGQNGEADPTTQQKVHEEGGLKNVIAENTNTDNSMEGTSTGKDEPVQKPNDKDGNATSSTDFLLDPLIGECDPSHRCLIEKQKFIACLKVSGDSSALSLLMDNKGTNPLDVSITAPDYVILAEDTVHVEANGHNETQVSVSVSDTMNDMAIVLKVAEETCKINLETAVTRNTGRVIPMRLTPTYMLVPVFVLLGLAGLCVKLRRAKKQDGGPAYQKLDAPELPVSVGGKKEDQPDQWDDNWGDDWDDEEAPSTPSNSMPNLSSKGLASRRSTKDGWKD